MSVYRNGSKGGDVARIQQTLKDAGLYGGEVDGLFGPGTESAVRSFQSGAGLTPDGVVGSATWEKLFPGESLSPRPPAGDLASRCLALTGSFETGRLAPECFAVAAGNFDGQGISFGALQWNLGQGTLQPLLMEMISVHRDKALSIFGDNLDPLQQSISGSRETALSFAASIQDKTGKALTPAWGQMFRSLGLTAEFQEIEVKGTAAYYGRAVSLCGDYGLVTGRGRALMFDICVQNGSISSQVRGLILADFGKIGQNISPEEREVAKMRIVANRRAEAANPKYVEDVRTRKLCIAEGKGVVHGLTYDLAGQFGLDLKQAD